MFIRRAPAAMFAYTFYEDTIYKRCTANRTLKVLIYTIEKLIDLKITPSVVVVVGGGGGFLRYFFFEKEVSYVGIIENHSITLF